MVEEQKIRIVKNFSVIVLIFSIIIFGYSLYCRLDDKLVFEATTSNKSVFEVNLTSGTNYKFVIDGGLFVPPRVDVTINKGSYIPLDEDFKTDPLVTFKIYYPYEPKFNIKENGTYEIHVNSWGSGPCKISIVDIHSGVD